MCGQWLRAWGCWRGLWLFKPSQTKRRKLTGYRLGERLVVITLAGVFVCSLSLYIPLSLSLQAFAFSNLSLPQLSPVQILIRLYAVGHLDPPLLGSPKIRRLMADALVEARDFGPPTGRGMAALRAVSGGAAVLSVPVGDLVTPRRCRALLRRRLQRGAGARPAPRPFASAGDLAAAPPRFVQPLEDWSAVRDACRAAGIDSHRDAQRTALLGCALRLVSVDPSDDTAECRKVGNKTAEDTIWFPVAALLPAEEGDSSAFVNALSDENALVVALLAARGGDLLAEEYSECPGLEKIVGEVPETVGLCCEWSHPEDFEGLKGSQHYDSAVSLRADVEGARDTVKTLMTQALGGDEQAAPFCGADLDEFVWSWAISGEEKETFDALGGRMQT